MSDTSLQLPETFKIDSVDDIYASLGELLAKEDAIVVDGSSVQNVDFAGLQLLIAFAHHCQTQSREFSFANLSEPLQAAVQDVGAGGILGVE